MEWIAGIFQGVFNFVGSTVNQSISWIDSKIGSVVHGFMVVVLTIIQWLFQCLSSAVVFLLDLILWPLTFLVGLLPGVPPPPATGTIGSILGSANTVLPLTETFAFATIYAVVIGSIYTYKGLKFIRGGG